MKYNSIVISGLPGSGKSILSHSLAKKYNWSLFSIGEIWREKWKEIYPNAETSFESYWKNAPVEAQKEINDKAREIVSKAQVVGDFRYAICCKGLPALFIFVKSDLEIRAQRALKANKYSSKSLEAIKEILLKREEDEVTWGKKLFGENYDYRTQSNYDLILDPGKLSLEQEIAAVDKKLNQ